MEQLALGFMIADSELTKQVRQGLGDLPARVVMELPAWGSMAEDRVDGEVTRSTPEVVFLETAAARERFPELIRLLKNRPNPPAVIAIHAGPEPDAILAAIRAGANDCVYPPLEEPMLRAVLERIAGERERRQSRRAQAKAVGFLSATGGCGGTTLACHFAAELRRLSGSRVLLADFDLVAGLVGFWMRAANSYSIRDAVRGLQRLDLSLWRGLVTTVQPQLDVVAAPAEVVTDDGDDPEQLLRVMRFARGHYDWVIADLGPGLTPVSLRLLGELDSLVLVSTAEVGALYQTRRILLKLLTLDYPQQRVRLLLSRLRKEQHVQPAEVEQALSWRIEALLPEDVQEIEEAQSEGRLISRKSELGRRIAQLAADAAGRQLEEKAGFWASMFRAVASAPGR